jgi:glucan phosphoethanolaminetransferase (alkaline phosphatase superfamily)
MARRPQLGHWLGLASMGIVVPLVYLFFAARSANRSSIYFVWLGLMILFQFVELIVDYILKLDFRSVRWMVIPYVMLFFGATGGMVGLAAQAGKWWSGVTAFTFLIMAVMAFIQRAKTGL